MKKNLRFRLLMLLLIVCTFPVLTGFEANYTTDEDGKTHPLPLCYVPVRVMNQMDAETGAFSFPQDLFYAPNGLLYVCDTGNKRVVSMTTGGEVVKVYTNPNGGGFKAPNGVFVDEDGDLYVADTDAACVVHVSPNDEFVEKFVQPDSVLYDSIYPFRPTKVMIDKIGQLYILNKEDYHGLIVMDALGEFKGYTATSRLPFDLASYIATFIATENQQARMAKRVPPVNSNFFIDEENTLYTTSIMAKTEQLKRYSVAGINIYPKTDAFGITAPDAMMRHMDKQLEQVRFTDVYVDAAGIVTMLENASGRLYQYDRSGNLLTIFGGAGNWAGRFSGAVSLTGDADGNLYVLDSTQGSIHVFEPTYFIETVHHALDLFYEGRYEESITPWEEVLRLDANYTIAHAGLGKAYLKQEKWVEAMAEYRIAGDKDGYSAAFDSWSREVLQNYFGWIVLAIVAVIAAAAVFITQMKKLYWKLNP